MVNSTYSWYQSPVVAVRNYLLLPQCIVVIIAKDVTIQTLPIRILVANTVLIRDVVHIFCMLCTCQTVS